MTSTFKRIGVMSRHRTPGAAQTLSHLKSYLQGRHLTVLLESESVKDIDAQGLTIVPREKLGETCDLVIVVGGDGSLLNAAHAVVNQSVPVLGINRGRLGFLTDIDPQQLEEKLSAVLDGQYFEEERFLIHAEIEREGIVEAEGDALNEVVLYAGDVARMIEFEVYVNNQFVFSQRSDGLIIATPTGSTAYALSAGGPIIHPSIPTLTLVPMFPHTLSNRPIVLPGSARIEIIVASTLEIYPGVSCDGQAPVLLAPGDKIRLYKKDKSLRLIHPMDYNYFHVLRSKLHWGKPLLREER